MKIVPRDTSRLRIEPHRTTLLVIDMQKGFLDKGAPGQIPMGRHILPPVRRVIAFCRDNDIRVIFTRMSHEFLGGVYRELFPDHFKPDGSPYVARGTESFQITEALDVQQGDIVLDKDRYSPFYGTNLDVILKDQGIDTVIITGQASNVCCESAARDAFFRDLRVVFLSDANATLTNRMHNAALENVRLCFGYVISSAQLFEIIRRTARPIPAEAQRPRHVPSPKPEITVAARAK